MFKRVNTRTMLNSLCGSVQGSLVDAMLHEFASSVREEYRTGASGDQHWLCISFVGDALAWWEGLSSSPNEEMQRLKREYHSIRQRASENSTEYMQRFLHLAGFLGQAAGTTEEQAKNFVGVFIVKSLTMFMCIQFSTDVLRFPAVQGCVIFKRDLPRRTFGASSLVHAVKMPDAIGVSLHLLKIRTVQYSTGHHHCFDDKIRSVNATSLDMCELTLFWVWTAEGITMDQAKVEAFIQMAKTVVVTEVRVFFGFAEKSFEELKQRLVSSPILTLPSGSGGFQIYSDASKKGLGCVLMQHGKAIAL
ncbi:putative reverse transcriptase domain-containing protein [Tanacetum coccineum]